ncbi:hypothetical protein KDU71_02595 [Carboxylicivirga sediminis]|uniref:Uncharacterized protein n=1 Tax=Carboxylicivirga sediminis TaxID=2006564 RepID=A0A941IWI4_9BACT|nr:hypothetical protein [Carboxylicivirga sediminis]MBR8534434.1 hypothetical protein [Carboxylicivirga sediminis]
MNEKIKEAVYVALCGAAFYQAAKYLKTDAPVALVIGTAVGQILATPLTRSNEKGNTY